MSLWPWCHAEHYQVEGAPSPWSGDLIGAGPPADIQVTLGPIDSLDHASRLPNYGSKMGIDATRKWKAEGFERPWPAMIEMDCGTKARVDTLWEKLGL